MAMKQPLSLKDYGALAVDLRRADQTEASAAINDLIRRLEYWQKRADVAEQANVDARAALDRARGRFSGVIRGDYL